MARADLLPFPSFSTPLPAVSAVAAARSDVAGATSYSPLAQEVSRSVQQFIQQGTGVSAGMASAQAQWVALQAARQLQAQQALQEKKAQRNSAVSGSAGAPGKAEPQKSLRPEQQAFLKQIEPWAQRAAQQLGVSVRSIMAHAALESAWGQKPLRDPAGGNSWNLFGLKAGASWQGPALQALTTEYEGGEVRKQHERFRQYEDLDASFADYVQLLGHSPRYRQALNTGSDVQAFAQALAQGGYATDPNYAQKLTAVSRLIAP